MNLASWLDRRALATPDAPALFRGKSCVASYAAFHRDVQALAGWLRDRGVGVDHHVALYMRNQPEYLIALWALWTVGAVVVPVNAKLHGREVAWILQNAGAELCISDPDAADRLRASDVETPLLSTGSRDWKGALGATAFGPITHRDDADLAWLFYTSGTTGRPKGVMITHGMLATMSLCYCAEIDDIASEDCALYAAPLSHGAGLYNMMHVLRGARHLFPESGGFDPVEIFDLASTCGRIHMFAAPTMVTRLTHAAKALEKRPEGFKTIVYAGGPMYLQDILDAHDAFGDIFVQIYGQGECPMAITFLARRDIADRSHPHWRARLASVGRAQAAVEVRVADADGRALPPGAIGEVTVRGATVMPGYWQNPEANERALRDGWLMTGDIGALDRDGYLTLHDRSKDLIISGGSNVYPREVEEVLIRHPKVREVSVVGRRHPDWGEEVVAFIVGEIDRRGLDELCNANIAGFKRPKDYLRVDELPKNSYGKVLKTELRKRLDR